MPSSQTTLNSLEKYGKGWELSLWETKWGPRGSPLPEMMARLPMALRKEHGPCFIQVLQSTPHFQVSLWYDCSDYHNLHPLLRAPYVTFPTLHKFTGRLQFICFLTNVAAWISEMQLREFAYPEQLSYLYFIHIKYFISLTYIMYQALGLVTELSLDA